MTGHEVMASLAALSDAVRAHGYRLEIFDTSLALYDPSGQKLRTYPLKGAEAASAKNVISDIELHAKMRN